VDFIKEDICAVAQNPAQTNISSRNNPQVEDDEDFVPYQGERFTVFDWMLFRVLFIECPLLISNDYILYIRSYISKK